MKITFLHPSFLLLLFLSIIILLLMALLLRSKPKAIPIISLMFLKDREIEALQHKKIRLPLLFIIDVLLFICLVLLLAKPILEITKPSKDILVFLDRSYTMWSKEGSRRRLEKAYNLVHLLTKEINTQITIWDKNNNVVSPKVLFPSYSLMKFEFEKALNYAKLFNKNLVIITDNINRFPKEYRNFCLCIGKNSFNLGIINVNISNLLSRTSLSVEVSIYNSDLETHKVPLIVKDRKNIPLKEVFIEAKPRKISTIKIPITTKSDLLKIVINKKDILDEDNVFKVKIAYKQITIHTNLKNKSILKAISSSFLPYDIDFSITNLAKGNLVICSDLPNKLYDDINYICFIGHSTHISSTIVENKDKFILPFINSAKVFICNIPIYTNYPEFTPAWIENSTKRPIIWYKKTKKNSLHIITNLCIKEPITYEFFPLFIADILNKISPIRVLWYKMEYVYKIKNKNDDIPVNTASIYISDVMPRKNNVSLHQLLESLPIIKKNEKFHLDFYLYIVIFLLVSTGIIIEVKNR